MSAGTRQAAARMSRRAAIMAGRRTTGKWCLVRAVGCVVLALSACRAHGQSAPGAPLLSATRVATLPAPERTEWQAYLARSERAAQRDRGVLSAELAELQRTRWTPAPVGDAFALTAAHTPDWLRAEAARGLIDIVLSYQTPAGGWSKRIDYTKGARAPGVSWSSADGWSYIGTFDNDATTEQLRFLARAFAARRDEPLRQAYRRGLTYTLDAQFPNGCWPQVYPLQGGYHDAVTFNDDAIVRVLHVLREAAADSAELLTAEQRSRVLAASARGVSCIVRSQVVVHGVKTVWAAQHDPLTLAPVQARAYEHASLSGAESAAVMRFLMQLDSPSVAVVDAVHAAAAWFRATAIHGYDYVPKGGLVQRADAGPIWARFYEIGTNRPIFSNRDGVIRYDFAELDEERRTGYAWYSNNPADALRAYERWTRRQPPPQR